MWVPAGMNPANDLNLNPLREVFDGSGVVLDSGSWLVWWRLPFWGVLSQVSVGWGGVRDAGSGLRRVGPRCWCQPAGPGSERGFFSMVVKSSRQGQLVGKRSV